MTVSTPRSFLALSAAMLGLALAAPAPADAELVVLSGGSVLKVKAYEVEGERALLTMPSGGRMTMALARIEHVVDDEVVPAPEPPPEPVVEAVEAGVPLQFDESQPMPEGPYGEIIYEAARRHQVNPRVIEAVIRQESAGNPRAVSHKGARGLMQLMPGTARRFGLTSDKLHDPQQNIEAGVKYLKWLSERFPGDLARVLAAYNAGEGAVERYGGIPPYRETRNYVKRIYTNLGLAVADLAL